jgi:hypothetical protein
MPPSLTDRANADDSSLGTRLDSWKEIANHLGRGERTVKRWETDRGLPVHRVPGGARSSVFAYTTELAEWLKSSKDLPLEPAQEDADSAEPEELAVVPAIAADDLTGTNVAARQADSIGFGLTRKWWLGLALISIAATAVWLSAFGSASLRKFAAMPSLLAKGQPKSDPGTSPAISDYEQRMSRDLYLRGRYQWNQRTPDSLNRALDSFTQSIVHDPGYAPAYVGLADTYDLLREYSTMPEGDAYLRAIAAAKKAVELDDSLSEAHRALAFAEFWGNWDFVGSMKWSAAIRSFARLTPT